MTTITTPKIQVTDEDAKLAHGVAQVIQRAVTPTPENRNVTGLSVVEQQGLRSLALSVRKSYNWGDVESLHGFLERELNPQAQVISKMVERVKHGLVEAGEVEYKGKTYKLVAE